MLSGKEKSNLPALKIVIKASKSNKTKGANNNNKPIWFCFRTLISTWQELKKVIFINVLVLIMSSTWRPTEDTK